MHTDCCPPPRPPYRDETGCCLRDSCCRPRRRRLLREPSLLHVPAGTVIVGDLHGDYSMLLRIFARFGSPPQQRYLFLGDFVDRWASAMRPAPAAGMSVCSYALLP